MQHLRVLWDSLYPDHPLKQAAWERVEAAVSRAKHGSTLGESPLRSQGDWYKDAVVYSLYVPQFAGNFAGLIGKLGYLKDLGATCLWLLPVLDSPMKDEGFDISDYRHPRPSLFPGDMDQDGRDALFDAFLLETHRRDMRVIFDIALNHCSNEHPWFKSAVQDKKSPFRDYFIWAPDDKGLADMDIIFSDTHNSNWAFSKETGEYYFHRFYDIQPDLNYRNPMLLAEIVDVLLYWQKRGVDGFRLDAAAHYWKEQGNNGRDAAQTHLIIRIFRAALDEVREGTMLLAEVAGSPKQLAAYFGRGDECHAAYHFPLTQRIYHAMAREDAGPVAEALSAAYQPRIPEIAQWFTFLRNHDEMTLMLEGPEIGAELHMEYCLKKDWEFRSGIGIAARLADLLREPDRVILAHALMFALPGTPIVYFGDEFFLHNDEDWAKEYESRTGIKDSRYRVRGPIPWKNLQRALTEREGDAGHVYGSVRRMLRVYNNQDVLRRGSFKVLSAPGVDGSENTKVLYIQRDLGDVVMRAAFNLSSSWQEFKPVDAKVLRRAEYDILEQPIGAHGDNIVLAPHGFYWAIVEGWSSFTSKAPADKIRA